MEKFLNIFKGILDFIKKYFSIISIILKLAKELSKLSKNELDDQIILKLEELLNKVKP